MDEYVLKTHFIYIHVCMYILPPSLPSIYYLLILFVYLCSFLLGLARLVFSLWALVTSASQIPGTTGISSAREGEANVGCDGALPLQLT